MLCQGLTAVIMKYLNFDMKFKVYQYLPIHEKFSYWIVKHCTDNMWHVPLSCIQSSSSSLQHGSLCQLCSPPLGTKYPACQELSASTTYGNLPNPQLPLQLNLQPQCQVYPVTLPASPMFTFNLLSYRSHLSEESLSCRNTVP